MMAVLPERPRNHTERRGNPKGGKIWEMRADSGIFRVSGAPFRFSVCGAHPLGFCPLTPDTLRGNQK